MLIFSLIQVIQDNKDVYIKRHTVKVMEKLLPRSIENLES